MTPVVVDDKGPETAVLHLLVRSCRRYPQAFRRHAPTNASTPAWRIPSDAENFDAMAVRVRPFPNASGVLREHVATPARSNMGHKREQNFGLCVAVQPHRRELCSTGYGS